jgi:phosphopantothenoylcysteine synthetase/decarboxylase
LGPTANCPKNKKIKVIRFKFFDELKDLLCRELKTGKYAALIHSAAVSDYKPAKVICGKLKSGLRNWKFSFKPTPKIIDAVKKIAPGIFLVGFKFEPDAGKNKLMQSAKDLMARSKSDLVVANTVTGGKYRAYILSADKISAALISKERLIGKLVNEIQKVL